MDTFIENLDKQSFKKQKSLYYKINDEKINLDIAERVLFLNEANVNVLKLYKKYAHYDFSQTLNLLFERNLSKLEHLVSSETIQWIDNLYEFLNHDSYNKLKKYVVECLYIPNERIKLEHEDVHVYINKSHINRIDALKNYSIFDNWTYDKIITYIISVDEHEDLSVYLRDDIKELYKYYKKELERCNQSINDNFVKINKEIFEQLFDDDGIHKTHRMTFLNYLNTTLRLIILKENKKEINNTNELKELINDVIKLLDEQGDILKKVNSEAILFSIYDKVKVLKELLNI